MWVAEFRVWHKGSVAIGLTKKYDVVTHNFYLNAFKQNGKPWVNKLIVVNGPDADKFVEEFHRDKRIHVQRIEGRQIFYSVTALEAFHTLCLDKSVFFFRPQIMKGGVLIWHIASWDKAHLLQVYNRLKKMKNVTAELIGIRQENFSFFVNNVMTDLTQKQLVAFQLACQLGYYKYPRRVSLEQLAKAAKLAYSTYKEHLRRAEEKIMPHVISYD